ncbi:MAG: sulfatase-like hydrolase/transferase, partial [bacterium]|nr:sulfatase-like hydrolase/transferase [bacterium]
MPQLRQRRRPLIRLLVLFAFTIQIALTAPNIVFVFADDWGYGDLGSYGHKELKTPSLDKLAAEGTRFSQFYVTSGVCSPSRTSVITGHFSARHGVHGHF